MSGCDQESVQPDQGYFWCPEPDPELVERAVARIEAARVEEAQIAREQQAIWAIQDDERWEQLNQQGVFAWDDPRFRDSKVEQEISEPKVS